MIILTGPPGSGKSVQGQLLAARRGWRWLSTGQLLRDQKEPAVMAELAAGRMIDDDLVNRVMERALHDAQDIERLVIDGFPRHLAQAEWLLATLPKHGREIKCVVVFDVSEDVIAQRLALRGRADDKPDIIRSRIADYRSQTEPIIDFYKQNGLSVCRLPAGGSIDDVYGRLQEIIERGC
ncbi:MAG: oxidoreductase [Candidatus Chaera renei]|uniref:Adenylate kinase n=1 Tax=Candidatus Chaera renei TaxID=2506947 RepID=A0A4Q0AJT9_9BACT|nr:MAG: oxidoreductase [Candidatus Chaera renei]